MADVFSFFRQRALLHQPIAFSLSGVRPLSLSYPILPPSSLVLFFFSLANVFVYLHAYRILHTREFFSTFRFHPLVV
jgi:hypothetical protein